MKICMLVHQNYFNDQRVIRYANSLMEKGHQADVICPVNKKFSHMKKSSPVKVNTIPVFHGNSNHAFEYLVEYGIAFIFYFLVMTWRYLIQGYDIVHVHNMPDFLVFAAIIPRIFGAKIILDIHDPFPEFYQSKFKASPDSRLAKILYLEERMAINFSHAVITANNNFRDNLVTRGVPEPKVTVVRNFPDRSVYHRERYHKKVSKNQEKFVIAYPGTIAPRYGLGVAIEGVAILIDDFPHLELRLIGPETAHKQELRELVAELGVDDHVKILPAVKMEEVPLVLAQANMGIYPAFPDPHMDIAIPTKVLEFTVMGLPVIASDLTVIRQLFEHGKVYTFPPGDHEAFAAILGNCLRARCNLDEMVAYNDEHLLPEWKWSLEREHYFDLINQWEE